MMHSTRSLLVLGAAIALGIAPLAAQAIQAPIRNITRVHGTMSNVLEGIGVVVGLNASGSGDRATRQALANFVKRNQINVSEGDLTAGAAALVRVTAVLPPFSKEGQKLEVSVGVLGDATSLFGGRLVSTQLKAIDGKVYATAAGAVTIGGFSAGDAGGTRTQRNHTTSGFVADGGTVVEAPDSYYLSEDGDLELVLLNPSEITAAAIATTINEKLGELTGLQATAVDRSLVRILLPEAERSEQGALRALVGIQPLTVPVENAGRVIVDETTGLVMAGEGVMISPCVLSVSDLTLSVANDPIVSQPLPGINNGETAIVNIKRIDVTTDGNGPQILQGGGATVKELLQNLEALNIKPRQLVEVFQALKRGGFLHAELIVR